MKAYLDGIPVQHSNDSIIKPTFTIRTKDENKENVFSFTNDLEFIEEDYTYIYQKLKLDPNASTNQITFTLEDDCCIPVKVYEFLIEYDAINWCENECRLTATAVEKSVSNTQLICLQNTMIYDNYAGFQQLQHPRMTYCNELRPDWLQHVIIILGVIIGFQIAVNAPFFAVIGLIITVINAVISVVNSIPGVSINKIDLDNNPDTGPFTEMRNAFTQLMSRIVGCGRKHPSPLVRAYASNVCGKCGLTFRSSIFEGNSPYRNTVYFNAPINKGTKANDNTTYWIEQNKPILNGTLFFDQLKVIFNADYKVKNNILEFERKDLLSKDPAWLDLTIYDPNDISVCWNWKKSDKFSYGSFQYFKDAVNEVGAEALARWGDVVEWNNPYTPTQSGVLTPEIPFSACRFRDDGIDEDVLSFYKNFPFVGSIIQEYSNVIIMNSHLCYQPMLLIWDQNSGVDNGKVDPSAAFFNQYYDGDGVQVNLNQFYNYPFWFQAGYSGNLYSNFFFIEDPRNNNFKGLEFKAEVELTCELLQLVDIDGKIKTSEGVSKNIEEITLNFASGILTVTGVV